MARVARWIWVAAFLVGASTHARDIAAWGWLPYDFAPLAFNWFWSLLLPLDLAAAGLLALRQRAGVVLGIGIMLADVAVNAWFANRTGWLELYAALQLQCLFPGFALGTAWPLWTAFAFEIER